MAAEPTVKAHLFRLKTALALPPNDPISVPVLRLMAATNDVRQAQKLALLARDPADPKAPKPPAAAYFVQSGEVLYLIRMLFGHLYEAGIIFRGIDQHHAGMVTKLVGLDKEAMEALNLVRKEYGDTSDTGFCQAVLGKVRNLAAFHYKDEVFQQGLERLSADVSETVLVIAEGAGFNRYAVADAVLDGRIVEATGGDAAGLDKALGRAVDLSRALDRMVAALASALIMGRAGAVQVGPEESIPVPPALEEARQRLAGQKGG